jgi:hypothetical protein
MGKIQRKSGYNFNPSGQVLIYKCRSRKFESKATQGDPIDRNQGGWFENYNNETQKGFPPQEKVATVKFPTLIERTPETHDREPLLLPKTTSSFLVCARKYHSYGTDDNKPIQLNGEIHVKGGRSSSGDPTHVLVTIYARNIFVVGDSSHKTGWTARRLCPSDNEAHSLEGRSWHYGNGTPALYLARRKISSFETKTRGQHLRRRNGGRKFSHSRSPWNSPVPATLMKNRNDSSPR